MTPEQLRIGAQRESDWGMPDFVLTRLGAGLVAFGIALLVGALLGPVLGYAWTLAVSLFVGITTASVTREWTQRRASRPPE